MSRIDFDTLQADFPEFRDVWSALRRWFDRNQSRRYVELSALLRALPEVEKLDIILAVHTMTERGMLVTAYRVKAPGGYLLEGDFDEPDQIPDSLPDRDFSGYIPTAESDIVTGVRWEFTGAA